MNGAAKLIIPGLSGIYDALGPWMYAFVRFSFGATIMVHGYYKLFAGGRDWPNICSGRGASFVRSRDRQGILAV